MMVNPRQTLALIDLAVGGKDACPTRVEGALRRLDGLTLLEWCIRRLNESTLIDSIVVTGPESLGQRLSLTGLCNARWIPSALSTPAQRAKEIADQMSAEWIVFSSPLCPFTDPTLLDRLVSRGWANPGIDFVGFISPKRPTFSLQSLGLVGEMCSYEVLRKMERERLMNEPCDVPEIVRRNPSLFQVKMIALPEQLTHQSLRFHVENEADWDRAHSYLEAAGDDLSWQRLAQVAERNPSY